jgi:hypothetical protein
MILFDLVPIEQIIVGGIGIVVFFLLIFGAIAFVAYKFLKRK